MSIDLDKFVGVIPSNLDALDDVIITSVTTGQSLTWNGSKWANQDEEPDLSNRIIVTQASDFGVIDSTKEYFLDGIIDMGGVSIEVPSGGIYISGFNFNISKLIDSTSLYTMFTSPVGGSGDVLFMDFAIEVTGTNSAVYDLVSDTGFKAVEISRINFNNCTSLGTLDNYRQGLETGTGRFGGTPNLILSGTWVGGYFIDTSIVRGLTNGVYSLFEEGTAFSMASRFRSNQNIDIPADVSFLDFQPSNFVNPSTVQITNAIISRNGVFDAEDANIIPNIDKGDLVSSWNGNKGIQNTFEGGENRVTTEITTTISSTGVFVDLAGTYTASDLQHFDAPANGQLRHLGDSPIEYKVNVFGIIDGGSNNDVELKIVVWDDSASVFVDYKSVVRVINNLQGGRDVAYFNFTDKVILNTNDYVKLMIANISGTSNVTAELDTEFTIEVR
jgi:hypothetical protein